MVKVRELVKRIPAGGIRDLINRSGYQCQYCGTRLKTEGGMMRHRCETMIKHQLLKTKTGSAAFLLYKRWLKEYKKTISDPLVFINSRFFNSFVRFIKYNRRAKIPDLDKFIKLMKLKGISPHMWTMDDVYVMYLEHILKTVTPLEQIRTTLSSIHKYCERNEIEVSEFFDTIPLGRMLQLIRRRKLSPFFLLRCSKFHKYFFALSEDDQLRLTTLMNPKYWQKRYKRHPKELQLAKEIADDLGL